MTKTLMIVGASVVATLGTLYALKKFSPSTHAMFG